MTTADELTLGAVYERTVAASLERVWENVHDWEHLPFLHRRAFSGIELEEAGPWGWRARVQTGSAESTETRLIELRRDPERECYHTRTLEGPGTGADTVVTLAPRAARVTDVCVEFWLPIADGERARAVGRSLVALYTELWDEDEAMMVRRQTLIDGAGNGDVGDEAGAPPAISLGSWQDRAQRLPLLISTSRGEYRVVETADGFFAHSTRCPHRGGPLHEAAIENDHVVCPWHGYRFSLADGRPADGRRCRTRPPPRVERGPGGQAELVFDPPPRAPAGSDSAD
jgi:nitrite reductase/ring-hydroxylating ferredoxin subunit